MTRDHRLPARSYMRFPFSIGAGGAATSGRRDHIREQIEQVLYTAPGERVFRSEFGAGVRQLVFEPNTQALAALTGGQLRVSLEEALRGEADARSIEIEVGNDPENGRLVIVIRYRLAAVGASEELTFVSGGGSG